ncbi:MAG TPA: Na+/H+ antiporter [Kofleriaceae bacterium]|nr:Na+/H+ antiporter [Kofleriaceae bacterium]
MIASLLETGFLLLAVLVAVEAIANRTHISSSILMVIAGCAMALIPGLPDFTLIPEMVLLLVLPPIIYLAGVQMSWREFHENLRPIALLAIGCVVFTTCAVAAVAHYVLNLSWPVGFVLGAIVAPPDVIAPLAIARRLGIPRRILVILEGEGLANDATALVLYRFAVAAVSIGVFSFRGIIVTFVLILVLEVAYGIALGWASLRLRRWIDDPRLEITLSLMTPYAAFWVPEHLGGSGVIATIATGLYVSWNGPLLISSSTRLQGLFFWDLLIYLIEGLVFLITGLQARTLFERIELDELTRGLVATGLTTAVVIASRFAWIFAGRGRNPSSKHPTATWQETFLLSFIGVRGVVSLTVALALPLSTASGAPFPARDLILFVTFGLIVITLVGQGLLIPSVIKWLGLGKGAALEHDRQLIEEYRARTLSLDAAGRRLDQLAAERHIAQEAVQFVRAHHDERSQMIPADLDEGLAMTQAGAALRIEAIEEERHEIHRLERIGQLTDEARRRIERELDLEEEILGSRKPPG